MKFWRNAAALLTVFHPETTHCGSHSTHKDVKNEGRSDYVYENKWRATKCHAKNAAFYTKMHPLRGNRQQSSGPFGRLCTNCATIRGEMTPSTVVALLEKLCFGDAEDFVEIGAGGFGETAKWYPRLALIEINCLDNRRQKLVIGLHCLQVPLK